MFARAATAAPQPCVASKKVDVFSLLFFLEKRWNWEGIFRSQSHGARRLSSVLYIAFYIVLCVCQARGYIIHYLLNLPVESHSIFFLF